MQHCYPQHEIDQSGQDDEWHDNFYHSGHGVVWGGMQIALVSTICSIIIHNVQLNYQAKYFYIMIMIFNNVDVVWGVMQIALVSIIDSVELCETQF